jgi:hypothetical protein
VPDTYDAHARPDGPLIRYRGTSPASAACRWAASWRRTYPEIGVPEAHHGVSHHQRDPHNIRQKTKIDAYNMSLFVRMLETMRDTPEGDGSLLDHSLLLYGAGMGDGDRHTPLDLPVVLAGGAHGRLQTGRHVKYEMNTPFMNLCRTLLDKSTCPSRRSATARDCWVTYELPSGVRALVRRSRAPSCSARRSRGCAAGAG